MERLEPIPESIKKTLARQKIWPPDIRLIVCGDMCEPGDFCEIWVIITDKQLTILKKQEEFTFYPIEDVEKFKVETLVSCGRFLARIAGQDRVICYFMNTHARKFFLFEKLSNKLKKGEELAAEDFADNNRELFCPKCRLRYPEPDRKICPKCMDKRSIFGRVLSFIPRYKLQIALILICMFASSALTLMAPYMGGKILFDEVLKEGGKYYGKVAQIVLSILGIRLAALIISILYGRLNAGMTARVIYDLKLEVFAAMQRLSMGFFSNKQTGNLMTRVNHDANHLQYFFHDGLPYFIVNVATLIGIATILMMMNWKLALLILVPVPFIILYLKKMFPRLWRLFGRRYGKTSSMNSILNDTLSGARVVKAFGKEQEEINRFEKSNHGVFLANMNLWHTLNTVFPLLHFSMSIGGFLVWGIGGWQVIAGTLTFGELMTFIGYMGMIYGPLEFMTRITDWWSSCMNSAQRIFEIIDAIPDITDHPEAVKIPKIKGDISLKDVTFSYEANRPVLQDVSFDVKAGEMIGLVGHTGAGKSTIANLISRLYDTQVGEIRIDGVNIKEIALKDLKAQIGMVSQETFLFIGSIAENIRYARPEATLEEIIMAAKVANAHDFIIKLPDGYDTLIGTGGRDLSGGERQRISIARAILYNPPILILDEATASVDTETEGQIQEALSKLVKGRTTISIAHRLSTLRDADRLVVIENGKVMESGTHMELIAQKGVYYKLYRMQSEAIKFIGVGQ